MIFDDLSAAHQEIEQAETQLSIVRAQLAIAKAGLNLGETTEWRVIYDALKDCLVRKGKRLLAAARQPQIEVNRLYRIQGEIAGMEEFVSVCDSSADRIKELLAEEERLTDLLNRIRTSLANGANDPDGLGGIADR